jgi:uncharacterized membrane protein YeaQ/YmgE (transglycosylase-associated protein family)
MSIIGVIIAGIIIGLLGRLLLPGSQPIGMLVTVLVGIAGTLIGWWIAGLFGVEDTSGVDWLRWIISVIVAVILVAVVAGVMGRNQRHTV